MAKTDELIFFRADIMSLKIPGDFMFQLTTIELENLISQFVISSRLTGKGENRVKEEG